MIQIDSYFFSSGRGTAVEWMVAMTEYMDPSKAGEDSVQKMS